MQPDHGSVWRYRPPFRSNFLKFSKICLLIGSEHRRDRGFPVSGDPSSRIGVGLLS
jgi:hypothetical protein